MDERAERAHSRNLGYGARGARDEHDEDGKASFEFRATEVLIFLGGRDSGP